MSVLFDLVSFRVKIANKLVGDITNDSAHLHIKSMDFTRCSLETHKKN